MQAKTWKAGPEDRACVGSIPNFGCDQAVPHNGTQKIEGGWFCDEAVDAIVAESVRRSGMKPKMVRLALGLVKKGPKIAEKLISAAEKKSGLSRQQIDAEARKMQER